MVRSRTIKARPVLRPTDLRFLVSLIPGLRSALTQPLPVAACVAIQVICKEARRARLRLTLLELRTLHLRNNMLPSIREGHNTKQHQHLGVRLLSRCSAAPSSSRRHQLQRKLLRSNIRLLPRMRTTPSLQLEQGQNAGWKTELHRKLRDQHLLAQQDRRYFVC